MDPCPEVDDYIEAAPVERRAIMRAIRQVCAEELHGFTEQIAYRMPTYRRDGETEAELAFASQKQYLSLYVTRTDVMDVHRHQLTGLSVGKGCIRYRRPEQVDLDVVRSIVRATAATRGPVC